MTLPHLLAQTQTSATAPASGTMTTAPAGAPTTQAAPTPFWGSPFFVPLILLIYWMIRLRFTGWYRSQSATLPP